MRWSLQVVRLLVKVRLQGGRSTQVRLKPDTTPVGLRGREPRRAVFAHEARDLVLRLRAPCHRLDVIPVGLDPLARDVEQRVAVVLALEELEMPHQRTKDRGALTKLG